MNCSIAKLTDFIKSEALNLGFHACGISRAESVEKDHSEFFESWLEAGYNGNMAYFARNKEKRYNPTLLYKNCKSVISVALNYFPNVKPDIKEAHMALFAYPTDYHIIVKELLCSLLDSIKMRLSEEGIKVNGRAFCDSAPVAERFWAWKGGLGWIGKNHCLIIPGAGSFFVLGELLVDLELASDTPVKGGCAECDACLKACPTKALSKSINDKGPLVFDSRLCLSYLTIEHKENLTAKQGIALKNCFYGCDICQEVCPHNREPKPTILKQMMPNKRLLKLKNEQLKTLQADSFNQLFKNSSVKRAGFTKISDNIAWTTRFTDKE